MINFDYDVVVIGGGPAGYNAAIRSSQLGFKTACVEKNKLGGTCLNVGCIPSKALLESSSKYSLIKNGWLNEFGISVNDVSFDISNVMDKKSKIVSSLCSGVGMLLSSNNIKLIEGSASFIDKNTIEILNDTEKKKISAKYFIIATGSYPVCLKNHEFDKKTIISSDSGVNLTEVPKEMVIIGAGVIGLELGSVWSRFGAKVTILEYLDKIAPTNDIGSSWIPIQLYIKYHMKKLLLHKQSTSF
jgi:dihydrolipoamide dehydrogenase